jgi:hypothetical protein
MNVKQFLKNQEISRLSKELIKSRKPKTGACDGRLSAKSTAMLD